jgi:hypothetical protein
MNFLLADYLPSPEVSNTMSVLANFLGGTGSQPTTNASLGSKWNAAPMTPSRVVINDGHGGKDVV